MKGIVLGLDIVIVLSSVIVFLLIVQKLKVFQYAVSLGRGALFAVIGIIGMFCDTIGIGSFASSMAIIKATRSMRDEEIPGYLNLMQILPNGLEAVLFLSVVTIDLKTFFSLVIATMVGGYISGRLVEYLPVQKIRVAMIGALCLVTILLLLTQLNLLPSSGEAFGLDGWKLGIGILCFFFIGTLPAIGVGGYAAMQVLLFLLGLNPLAVFPIMTTCGSFQQVATTISFLGHKRLPVREALIAGVFGCLGVLLAFSMVRMFSSYMLHWLLLLVILFNIFMISRSYIQARQKNSLLK